MPNHIHGIINIVGVDRCVDPLLNNTLINTGKINHTGRTRRSAPTISIIIRWFKTMTTNQIINKNDLPDNGQIYNNGGIRNSGQTQRSVPTEIMANIDAALILR